MIVEKDMLEAIAECQGERNPNANTCIKLAAYYTILDNIRPKDDVPETRSVTYSYDPPEDPVYSSDSEFGTLAAKKDILEIMGLMDELMDALKLFNPKLYDATMRKLASL